MKIISYFWTSKDNDKYKNYGKSKFVEDFKAFVMKGNVVDMAVGVIIGGAFGKINSSTSPALNW